MGKRDRASHPHKATSELLRLPPNNNSTEQQNQKPHKEGDKASRKAARKAFKAANKRAELESTAADAADAAMSNPADDHHPAPAMDAQAMPPKKKARKAVEVSHFLLWPSCTAIHSSPACVAHQSINSRSKPS